MHSESPFRKALRESRTILLTVLFLVLGFNLFASNHLPWLREPKPIEQASDDEIFNDDIDTNATGVEVPIDTGDVNVTVDTNSQAWQDSAKKARALEAKRLDSIKKEMQRIKDSIDQAKKEQNQVVEAVEGEIKAITTAQAKALLDRKKSLFIDARRSDQFEKGHISGAMNIYAYEFDQSIPKVINIPKDRQIVVYCDGGACDLSHELADQLKIFGFKKLLIYTGGWEEWSETDYPKATGQ